MKHSLFVILLVALAASGANCQDRCGTVEYTKKLQSRNVHERDDQFENWIQQKSQPLRTSGTQRTKSGPYKIPVVVHVIHNGEAEGSGTNIPDAQILSQIRVLNEDYRRENADAANTPAEFSSIAGSMDIEFVLAKSDPEGLDTDGIVRVLGTQSEWQMNDNYKLKSLSYWPAENYMNIWVCNLTDFLGYAQFPVSNLGGLDNSSNNRLTDGVVIWYRSFGSIDDGNFNLDPDYNKGRTATHEISHFFGLRHIWGDDGGACGGAGDYVSDTPDQGTNSTGCPAYPKTTCGVSSMFQNFTDYTDDACMNLFTQNQVSRMETVIENSPRRASLLSSPGLNPPAPVPNDIGVRNVISPKTSECDPDIIPSIEIRNYGSNVVTTARIRYRIDGNIVETKDFALNLAPLASTLVSFDAITLGTGTTDFNFEILLTNGVADSKTKDNVISISVLVPETISAPFIENFNSFPDGWTIINPDQGISWEITGAPNNLPSNQALMMNFYDYEDKQGELDIFLSPVFDLTDDTVASVIFDVAYARYQTSLDRLKVYVVANCSSVLDGFLIYDKGGSSLATADPTSSEFVPNDETEWRRNVINIDQFLGETHVQLAFVGVNDWGNKLYLDNVGVITTVVEDVSLARVVSPSIVTCDETPAPRLAIQNLGNKPLKKLSVEYAVNGGAPETKSFTNLDVEFGDEIEVQLPSINLNQIVNTISFKLLDPNDSSDDNPSNNEMEIIVMINKSTDRIPLRENFNSDLDDRWIMVNPENGMNWQTITTNYEKSVYFNAFDNTEINDQAWLVSPSLDFTLWPQASLTFDVSARTRLGRNEDLAIYALKDCGNTYEKLDFTLVSGQSLSESWKPAEESDWVKMFVNLDMLAGLKDVRIAFVVTNRNSNNLYLDNIEFFTSSEPDQIVVESLYSVYGYSPDNAVSTDLTIKFNLPEKQPVHVRLVDTMGKTISSVIVPDVLNQTLKLDTSSVPSTGVYIVYLLIGNKPHATRVLITH